MLTFFTEISQYLPPLAPLLQLFFGLAFGLFFASLIEALQLTKILGKLAKPLVSLANLGQISSASFALAIASPASANALLGENLESKKISSKEVILANLFNTLPSTVIHIPTLFFMSFPLIGYPALIYVFCNFLATLLRSIVIIFLGRILLPKNNFMLEEKSQVLNDESKRQNIFSKTFVKFRRRILRILLISIPIYCAIYYLQYFGYFNMAEKYLAENLGIFNINTKSLSIVLLYMSTQMQAAFVAAAALYSQNVISGQDVVLALLIGNIFSSPFRALRHQLPAYLGYFRAGFAINLLMANQASRTISLLIITICYYIVFF